MKSQDNIVSSIAVAVSSPILGRKTQYAITLSIFLIFIISVLALCTRSLGTDLVNADGLWMEDYLRDRLVRGVDMTTWQPAMAPNYFPEMLIYGLIRYITGSVYLGFMGFRIIKVILYAYLLYKLLSLLTDLSRVYRLWIALLLSCGIILATILVGGTQDFWQIYVPTAHGGALVNTLGAIIITLYWLRNCEENQWRSFILLAVLSTAATLSDMIYVAWFTIPAMATMCVLVVLSRITKRSYGWLFVACLLVPVLLERISHSLTPYKEMPGSFALKEGWKATSNLYLGLLAEGWYQRVILFCFICLTSAALYVLFNAWKKRAVYSPSQVNNANKSVDSRTSLTFLLPYAALVTPSTFLAMAAINRPAPQYLMGGDFAALSFFIFVLVMTKGGKRLITSTRCYVTIVFLVIAGFVGLMIFSPPNWNALAIKWDPMQRIYPDLAACLDSHAADFENGAGMADYWEVRPINLFSKKGLHVDNVVAGNLSPIPVQAVSSREMFENKKRTWIITDTTSAARNIREDDMVRWQGEPDVRFFCTGFPVLVYKNGINVIVENNSFMNRPTLDTMVADFSNGSVNHFVIPSVENRRTQVGELKGGSIYSAGKAGYLQFGPYIALPAGSYRIEWHGKVEQGIQNAVGSVDATFTLDSTILANAPVNMPAPGVTNKDVLAAVEFSVDHPVGSTQFRFYVNETAMVRLDEVEIIRLEVPGSK